MTNCSITLPRCWYAEWTLAKDGESPRTSRLASAAPPALSTGPHLTLVAAPSSGPLRSPSDFPLREKRLRLAERWCVRHGCDSFPQLTRSLLEPTCRWAGTSLPCAARGLVAAVSGCLAWHATPLRGASATALFVRVTCVHSFTPAGGLCDGWFVRTSAASSGTGPLPAPPHRTGRRTVPFMHPPGHSEAPGREPPRHRNDDRTAPPPR